MKKSLNLAVSSGGTAVPVDDVRILTNRSKGTTGAFIAEAALRRGHNVNYVHAGNARVPFEKDLCVNVENDIEEELKRVRSVIEEIRALPGTLNKYPVQDFFAYRDRLLQLVGRSDMDVAILAMAASDYGPKKVEGKISSDGDGLDLRLYALPKIITEVKQTREGIFLVGFKLLTEDADREKLLRKAFASMGRDGQDLAVANIVDEHFAPKETYILTPQQEVIQVHKRKDLPGMLLDQIEERVGQDA